LPHESFIHWSLGSRQSLRCLSKRSKCLLPLHPKSCYIFKDGQQEASFHPRPPKYHTNICARPHTVLSYYVYPVSPCLVGDFCGLARTRGPCSQDTFTPDAAILAKSRTRWRKRKEGSCCGNYTTNHTPIDAVSSQAPPSALPPLHFRKPSCHLSSVTPELYATCFAHHPDPMPIKRPHD